MCLVAYTPAAFNAAALTADRASNQPSLFGEIELIRAPVHRDVPNRIRSMLAPVTRPQPTSVPTARPSEGARYAEIEDEIPERWDGLS